MSVARILRIYLEADMLEHARSGGFGILSRLKNALELRGFRVEFRRNSDEERQKSAQRQGYSLFHMQDPFHDRALNLRRSYFYPYWRIENTAERWKFEVAQKAFYAPAIDAATTKDWADGWRKWLLKTSLDAVSREGPIYVPLQGRLLSQRSFQVASPIQMLRDTLERNPLTPVLAGLHPGELYEQDERDAVDALGFEFQNLTVRTGQMEGALKTSRFVVTQNSSAALMGYFLHKPAVLYGKVDFHHIAANVADLGVDGAFDAVADQCPEFDKYLFWFTEMNAIKADADDAEERLLNLLARRGWDVD